MEIGPVLCKYGACGIDNLYMFKMMPLLHFPKISTLCCQHVLQHVPEEMSDTHNLGLLHGPQPLPPGELQDVNIQVGIATDLTLDKAPDLIILECTVW